MIKRTITTIIFLCLCLKVSAQQIPKLVSPLSAAAISVCEGATTTLSAKVSDTKSYVFQIKNNQNQIFENIANANGLPDVNGNITFILSSVTESNTYRLVIAADNNQVISNEVSIQVSQINFSFQPINITQCNGLNADFRVGIQNLNAMNYSWQSSSDGTNFNNITASSKYVGVNTNNLQVKSLTNSDHNSIYRCQINDNLGCTTFSNTVNLYVNQLSTVVSPTTTTKFCEGSTAQFSVTGAVGNVLSYQWQIKKTNDAAYIDLAENAHYVGINTPNLSVIDIKTDETAYKLKANFENISQNSQGQKIFGTCEKTASRTGYTIYAKPSVPAILVSQSKCGSGEFVFNSAVNYKWYFGNVLKYAGTVFNTGILSQTQTYAYSFKDNNGCESNKNNVSAEIIAKPILDLKTDYEICQNASSFTLAINSFMAGTDKYNIKNVAFQGFTDQLDQNINGNKTVLLPTLSKSGIYKLVLFGINSLKSCVSDSIFINIKVLDSLKIQSPIQSQSLCEGSNFSTQVFTNYTSPLKYEWYKNDLLLTLNTALFQINNVFQNDQGTYFVKLISECEEVVSNKFNISVLPKTIITQQIKAQTVCENTKAVFSLAAQGYGKLHYQWFENNQKIGVDSNQLIIEKVVLSSNNHKIYCQVSSECLPTVYSDTVILKVNKNPSLPEISKSQFCQNTGLQNIQIVSDSGNSLSWFSESDVEIAAPIIDTKDILSQTFYVLQKDAFGCLSDKTKVLAKVDPSFDLSLNVFDKYVCAGGRINLKSHILAGITPQVSGVKEFELIKNQITIAKQSDPNFYVNAGNYTLNLKINGCQSSQNFELKELFPEILVNPTAETKAVCIDQPTELIAKTNFGKCYWWPDSLSETSLNIGNVLNVDKVNSPHNYFVSAKIANDTIICETQRVKVILDLKPPLKATVQTILPSCKDFANGKITVNLSNGHSPFVFTLNNKQNETGIFSQLLQGNYKISVTDSEGCKFDSLLNINENTGPKFTLQPQNITRCKGNVANFSANVENYSSVQWQKKLPSDLDFSDIVGANTLTYHVDNVGSAAFLHQTQFRIKAIQDSCMVFSNVAYLYVNSISGSSVSKNSCEGSNLSLDLNSFNIIGKVSTYQWQSRPGTSGTFEDVIAQTNAALNLQNVQPSASGYYRNKLVFDNLDGSTCILNTSTTGSKISIESKEIPILSQDQTICQGQTANLTATNCSGSYQWSDNQLGSTILVKPNANTVYSVKCVKNDCVWESANKLTINVNPNTASDFKILPNKLNFCKGDTALVIAKNCNKKAIWFNEFVGDTLKVLMNNSLTIWAKCDNDICGSTLSDKIELKLGEVLKPGQISDYNSFNCAGYNPGTITNISLGSGGINLNYLWQKNINCSSDTTWTIIPLANGSTYNPDALTQSTCFRRVSQDSCGQMAYSNVSHFTIQADPIISINANKTSFCDLDTLVLSSSILGGVLPCNIIWQQNEVSSSSSSSFWVDFSTETNPKIINHNLHKKVYYRAVYDCSNASCNKAYSNILAIDFSGANVFETNFSDSSVCVGNKLTLSVTGCSGNVLWNALLVGNNEDLLVTKDTVITVSCQSICAFGSKKINIKTKSKSPIPVNNTPIQNADVLIFSAVGQNLKWYSTQSAIAYSTTPPNYYTAGVYDAYVTQTDSNGCESEKLKITAELIKKLSIETQPESQVNCKGNTVNFKIIASGNSLKYQWQRKLPNEVNFVDLNSGDTHVSGFDSPNLKISYVGDANNPNLCQYRCIIKDTLLEVISKVVQLNVNSVEGSLDNQNICIGSDLDLDISKSHKITGETLGYQWQQREGTGSDWVNVLSSSEMIGGNTSHLIVKNLKSTQQFRCSVLFNTCTENTDLMTAKVLDYPAKPDIINASFCEDVPSAKINVVVPSTYKIKYYCINGMLNTELPKVNTADKGVQNYYYSFVNNAGCESEKASIEIQILPKPNLPINTTASGVVENTLLIFSALGENLKWYSTATTKTFKTTAPEYTKIGTYNYYVSQTDAMGCESNRLKITASITASFAISSQPTDQQNCDGNTVTFSLKIKGSSKETYQWQKFVNQKFVNINDATTKDLKISNVGDSLNLEGSQYRCLIQSDSMRLVSDTVALHINKIIETNPTLNFCENIDFKPLETGLKLSGEAKTIEWQLKNGSVYNTVFTVIDSNQLVPASQLTNGTYRYRVTFKNAGSSTCVRYSNTFVYKTNKLPKSLSNDTVFVCQNAIPELFAEKDIQIFEKQQNVLVPYNNHNFDKSIIKPLWTLRKSAEGCIAKLDSFQLFVRQKPLNNFTPLQYSVCKYDTLRFANEKYLWFENQQDSVVSTLNLNYKPVAQQMRWVKTKDLYGCESDALPVTFNFKPCYYAIEKDTCVLLKAISLENEFVANTNKLVVQIDSSEAVFNQNLIINAKFKFNAKLIDIANNEFLPRYFHIVNPSKRAFKIRFFIQKNEIMDGAITPIVLVNYFGKNQDCDLSNNVLENHYCAIGNSSLHLTEDSSVYFVDFTVSNSGEYALWPHEFPKATIQSKINDKNEIQLNIKEEGQFSTGRYIIEKSIDNIVYTPFDTIAANQSKNNITDVFPFEGLNHYRLSYDFGNKIIAKLNTSSIIFKPEKTPCSVLPNPIVNSKELSFYFPNIKKSTVLISNLLGQEMPIKNIIDFNEKVQVHTTFNLRHGVYIISAQNLSGGLCKTKFIVE